MGSEPATWCGLVGGLTERERGTVCAGRASALLRGAGRGGPFSATRAVYGTRQTHVFHERGIRVRRGAVTARGAELLWVLALWAADLDSDGIVGDGANASSGGALWPVAGTARSGSAD